MQEHQSSSESSDEDEELLLAASEWAESSTQNDQVEESNSNGNSDQQSTENDKKKDISDTSSSRNNEDSAAATKDTISKSMHTNKYSTQQEQTYSLHMTKVPYTATQTDIRFAFGQKGCNITSIRLVYDRDQKTGERHFRGVAFVDLADEKSYNKALEFHNKPFLGKGLKVGVRPTVPKSQLSDIVRKTEEKVATLIARSKETAQKKREAGDNGDAEDKKERPKSNAVQDGKSNKHQDRGSVDDKKKHKKRRKSPNTSSSKDSAEATSSSTTKKPKGNDSLNAQKAKGNKGQNMKKESNKKNTKPEKNTDGSPIKLTKKQRAKKAAIIRMRKLKSRK